MIRMRKQSIMSGIFKDITFKKALQDFMEEKRANNLSKATLKTYSLHIEHFLNSIGYFDMPTSVLAREDWNWWIENMQEDEEKQDVTISSYARSVKAFMYWLMENEYSNSFNLKIPKYQKKIKQTYSDEEMRVLMEMPRDCTMGQYQTWVFINVVSATGLRLSSLLNIRVDDYNAKENYILIQETKNNLPQTRYINKEVSNIISKYIQRFDLVKTDYLFCIDNGEKMAIRTMQQNVLRYNRNLGLEKTSIHLFRHTFSKNYILAGGDIMSLKNLLQHKDLSTTLAYLTDLGLDTKEAVKIFNPQTQFAQPKRPSSKRKKIKI